MELKATRVIRVTMEQLVRKVQWAIPVLKATKAIPEMMELKVHEGFRVSKVLLVTMDRMVLMVKMVRSDPKVQLAMMELLAPQAHKVLLVRQVQQALKVQPVRESLLMAQSDKS